MIAFQGSRMANKTIQQIWNQKEAISSNLTNTRIYNHREQKKSGVEIYEYDLGGRLHGGNTNEAGNTNDTGVCKQHDRF